MRIYDAEKQAGLAQSLCGDNGLGVAKVVAKVKEASLSEFDKMIASLTAMSANVSTIEDLIGQDQPDLALVVSVLASVGWNLNDDVFTPPELWAARGTAIHKPMNHMHNGNIILGHIVKSHAVDKFGHEIVLEEGDEIPREFDIEVAGVLYKALPERTELIQEILAKAKDGEMFVSMECWFPDFAYGFLDPDTGRTRVVERDESTAFLTKHLRIFNGTGEFQGKRVGRVLKDFVFGGQGFVTEPANPESVIKMAAQKLLFSNGFENVTLTDISKGGVDSMDQKEIDVITKELEETKAGLETLKTEKEEIQKKLDEVNEQDFETKIGALQAKIDELASQLTEANSKAETVQGEKVELQKRLDDTVAEFEKAKSELETIKKSAIAKERLAKLSEVSEVKDKEKTLAELAEMSPETFEIVLKYAGKEKADESDQETNAGSEANAVLDDAKVNEEVDVQLGNDEDSSDDTALALAHTLTGNKHKIDEGGE